MHLEELIAIMKVCYYFQTTCNLFNLIFALFKTSLIKSLSWTPSFGSESPYSLFSITGVFYLLPFVLPSRAAFEIVSVLFL